MEIRRVAPDDPSRFHDFYSVWRAAEIAGRPGATPSLTEEEGRQMVDNSVATEQVEAYVGVAGGVAAAGLVWYSLVDNRDLLNLHVAVDPTRWRRGHGSVMLTRLIARATELDRHVVVGESWIPFERRADHPYLSFAARHGFAVANVEIRRILDLPVDDATIARWRSDVAPRHRDYRIQTVRGEVPGELVPSLVEAMNLMGREMPTGDIEFEPRAMTPEIFAVRDERNRRSNKEMLRAVAVKDGAVVGFTTLSIPLDLPDVVFQYGTLVRRSHRGHGLGLAVKAAALQELQSAHPDRTHIETANSEQNAAMVAINDMMGFRPVELHTAFQRRL